MRVSPPIAQRRSSAASSPSRYAVIWRVGDGPTAGGSLEFEDNALLLCGSQVEDRLRIPFDELVSIEIERGSNERLKGEPSLQLVRRTRERVLVSALGAGVLIELTELLATLRAEHLARTRVVVVMPIKRGASQQARRLLSEGPPFDARRLGLTRHEVFVTEREVVFIFEGESAVAVVDELASSPRVLRAAVSWKQLMAGRPRLAAEGFTWTRTE